jgi:hypothetical protein
MSVCFKGSTANRGMLDFGREAEICLQCGQYLFCLGDNLQTYAIAG